MPQSQQQQTERQSNDNNNSYQLSRAWPIDTLSAHNTGYASVGAQSQSNA